LDGFCAPLGSSPELFNPPELAGPGGTPVMPCVPAPAEPALGEPAALLLPAEGPLVAPPALAPALAPPPVPPLLPLPLWASDMAGDIRIVTAATAAAADASFIGNLLFRSNDVPRLLVPAGTIPPHDHSFTSARPPEWSRLRKLIAFDDDTLDKLTQLARDRMATFQELADEAFADLLKKHGIPIDLRDALRKSAGISKVATARKARSKPGKTPS
jgi:hypothetical protein